MNLMTQQDPRQLLRGAALRASKRLGQHFLIDPNTLRLIVAAAELDAETWVLEIGAGTGALTIQLAATAKQVYSVEVDERLRPILAKTLARHENIVLRFADFLKLDYANEVPAADFIVVANLPYYISNAILRRLLEAPRRPKRLVLTLQREVADRILATQGKHSLLSLSTRYYGQAHLVRHLSTTVFWPQPKVTSSVLRLDEGPGPRWNAEDEAWLFQVMQAGFQQKRKQLRNSLSRGLGLQRAVVEDSLQEARIEPKRRAETLSLSEWQGLARNLGRIAMNG